MSPFAYRNSSASVRRATSRTIAPKTGSGVSASRTTVSTSAGKSALFASRVSKFTIRASGRMLRQLARDAV
ncbi:MAG TPA: hypothetical protein DD637_06785 [Verrucomicrobia bacterium]|nr:hypothetical protein [Verrucomicrobiota bacterium]HCG20568.1 hypothetical protein [Verrucomicrobiota bacterium]